MKVQLLTLLLYFTTISNGFAQTLNWSTVYQNAGYSGNFISETDDSGNIYSVSQLNDSVFFQNTNFQYRQTVNGRNQLFICKQNRSGHVLWFKSIGNQYYTNPIGLRIDKGGSPIILGNFEGSLDFNPDSGVFNMFGYSSSVLFVLKLDTGGVFQWAQKIEGIDEINNDKISLDLNDNIYITGNPNGTVDFDGDTSSIQLGTSNNGFAVFSWDKNGTFRWAHAFDSLFSYSNPIALDIDPISMDIILIGMFDGSYDFDPSAGVSIKTSLGVVDYFILKMDTIGQFNWVKVLSSTNITYPANLNLKTLELSSNSSIIITGSFTGNIDFNPGSSSVFLTTHPVFNNEFILKLDRNGLFKWVKKLDSYYLDIVSSDSDPLGGIYLAGNFSDSADLDVGLNSRLVISNGGDDGFLLRLDSMGNYHSSGIIGGQLDDYIESVNVDKEFNLQVYGSFGGVADLDPSSAINNSTALYSSYTQFYLKLFQCIETYSSINVNTCDTYTSPSLKKVWNTSGVYKDTLVNFIDCDSIITVNLRVDTVDIATAVNNNSITANASNATFRWLDCANNYTVIPNQIANIYTAAISGSYAVEVTQNNCVDTSVCQPIVVTQIDNNQLLNALFISPNPTKGVLNVSVNTNYDRLWMTDLSGKMIYNSGTATHTTVSIDLTQFENGLYFLSIERNGERVVKKIVKQ